jgi:hypothetical protein
MIMLARRRAAEGCVVEHRQILRDRAAGGRIKVEP